MVHGWMQASWQRLVALDTRLPHALLFIGPAGLGKRDLAEALAARLLCMAPGVEGHACGQCATCQLRLTGNHPDLYRVVPEAQVAESADDGAADTAAPAKAKSSQIVIEQIRRLQEALMVTGHQSSRRVVVVEPAEAMNGVTANALLKLLEEPPEGCVFVLVSSQPRHLLATIRSRCQQWQFARPDADELRAWVDRHGEEGRSMLALCGGLPLAAERLLDKGVSAMLARFVGDVNTLATADPVRLAGQWEMWLKSKEASGAGFGMVQLADWMQRWVTDLATLSLGGRVRYFPAHESALTALVARTSVAATLNCYNELARIRRAAGHPLNARLMLEDMLLRYARTLNGYRP
jgi:DNA polymerase-3 subunit delta'